MEDQRTSNLSYANPYPKQRIRFGLKWFLIAIALVAVLFRIVVWLNPTVRITGRLVATNKNLRVGGIKVFARSQSGEVFETETSASGHFRFSSMARGQYQFWVEDDEVFAQAITNFTAKERTSVVMPMQLSEGGKCVVRFLAIETGAPTQQGQTVRVFTPSMPDDTFAMSKRIAPDGSLSLKLPPGVSTLNWGRAICYLQVEEDETRDVEVYLSPNGAIAEYIKNEKNGHFYTAIEGVDVSWREAVKLAQRQKHRGVTGHLVTVTSKHENQFLVDHFGHRRYTWLGGSDEETEGEWKWVCGPEKGRVFYEAGKKLNVFHNWDRMSHFVEPNNMREKEHYLLWNWTGPHPNDKGRWNDWDLDRTVDYVIVEFSSPTQKEATIPTQASEREVAAGAQSSATEVDVFCLSWDDLWIAYGLSIETGKVNHVPMWSTWTGPGSAAPYRASFAYDQQRIAIIAGFGQHSGLVPQGHLFDFASGSWKQIPSLPIEEARRQSFVELVGDDMVVMGPLQEGGYAAVFDMKQGTWRHSDNRCPITVKGRTMHGVVGSKVLTWGGYPNADHRGVVYDSEENTWQEMPEAPLEFAYAMSCGIWEGSLYVFGGDQVTNQTSRIQLKAASFDPATMKWSSLAAPPAYLPKASAYATSRDLLFIFSNGPDEDPNTSSAIYNFRSKTWQRVPESPLTKHTVAFMRAISDKGFAVTGGWDGSTEKFVRQSAFFDIEKWQWSELPPLPVDVPQVLHPGW